MHLKPLKNEQITKNFNAVEFFCNDPFRTVPPASLKLNIYYVAIQLQKNSRLFTIRYVEN